MKGKGRSAASQHVGSALIDLRDFVSAQREELASMLQSLAWVSGRFSMAFINVTIIRPAACEELARMQHSLP